MERSTVAPIHENRELPIFYLKCPKPTKIETLSQGKHLKLTFDLEMAQLQVLYFNHGDLYTQVQGLNEIELFGQLSINKFRNFENIQMILKDIR